MQHPSLFAQSLLLLLPPALTLAGPGDLPPGAIPLGGPGGPAGPPGGAAVPPKVEPTKLDNFTWTDPFSRPDRAASHRAACESARTFAASEHQLHDLSAPAPAGLQAYGGALKGAFGGRPYPGGWDGVDAHGYERTLLRMEWGDVPSLVRRWVRAQEQQEGDEEEEEGEAGEAGTGRGKGLFAVFDKPGQGKGEAEAVERTVDWSASEGEVEEEAKGRVVVFAPGAIYETLPLWVAEGSECEDALADLSNYGPQPVDGGVVGWPTEHTEPARSKGLRDITFTIKARLLEAEADAPAEKEARDPVNVEGKDEL